MKDIFHKYIDTIIDINQVLASFNKNNKSLLKAKMYNNINDRFDKRIIETENTLQHLYSQFDLLKKQLKEHLETDNVHRKIILRYIRNSISKYITKTNLNKYKYRASIVRSSVIESFFVEDVKVIDKRSGERPILSDDILILRKNKKIFLKYQKTKALVNFSLDNFFMLYDAKVEEREEYDFIDPLILRSISAVKRSEVDLNNLKDTLGMIDIEREYNRLFRNSTKNKSQYKLIGDYDYVKMGQMPITNLIRIIDKYNLDDVRKNIEKFRIR